MVIKRNIKGFEYSIELTAQELFDAYCEQEHIYDVDYVNTNAHEEIAGLCHSQEEYDEGIELVAFEMRRRIDKYNMEDWFALEEAMGEFKDKGGY